VADPSGNNLRNNSRNGRESGIVLIITEQKREVRDKPRIPRMRIALKEDVVSDKQQMIEKNHKSGPSQSSREPDKAAT
jgi:hypothetical protein